MILFDQQSYREFSGLQVFQEFLHLERFKILKTGINFSVNKL